MVPFELFIAYIAWDGGGKSRPVLAFMIGDDTVDIYRITTRYEGKSESVRAQYFMIEDWAEAGLDAQSYVDAGTLIALSQATFKNKQPIGKLTENDKRRFLAFLNS